MTPLPARNYHLTMPTAVETAPAKKEALPIASPLPLENGDALSSGEFLRRYRAMPRLKKAELVEGIVYMGSPVSRQHAKPDGIIQMWAAYFASHTPVVEHLTNATVILDAENTIQPDALLRLDPRHGGRTRVTEDHLISGPPELVVEVAASSASIDLHDKLRACQRNLVPEYLVWLVAENEFKWFALQEERYKELAPDSQGLFTSRTFSTLVLPIKALLAFDSAAVIAALEQRIKSPAHAEFLKRLVPAS